MSDVYSFSPEKFSHLFPFHIVMDADQRILSTGDSLKKVCKSINGAAFENIFSVKRPTALQSGTSSLKKLTGQLVILEYLADPSVNLRGEFLALEKSNGKLLFVGTPWFASMDEVVNHDLTLHDFALHDPMIDLLHALRAQEISTRDIRQLLSRVNEQKEHLVSSEKRISTLLSNLQIGVLLEDEHNRVVLVNQLFCDLFRLPSSPEQLRGEAANLIEARLIPGFLDSESLRTRTRTILAEKKMVLAESLELRDGRTLERDFIPIFVADQYRGHLWKYTDVTHYRNYEKELLLAKRKAEESSRAKESFLANMSHEIRTPLNAIVGMVRELSKELLTEKQRTYLSYASSASMHLLSTVNNILDITKIEAGALHLEKSSFSLLSVFKEAQNILIPAAREKLLELSFNISPELDALYLGDPNRIRQVLINIIGNAIKFTESGQVQVTCSSLDHTATEEKVSIVVKDTGIGMDRAYVQHLFKKFTQEDLSTARRYGGTGLGMAITHELIQLMNGEIRVESEREKGTTVFIELPLSIQDAKPQDQQRPAALLGRLKNKKILLAEDNRLNRLVVRNFLAPHQVILTEVTNGLEAVDAVKSNKYDLILMDVQMPWMDGIAATKVIREELHLDVPIIALTAHALTNEIDKCLDAGMNNVVTKPFEESYFLSVLDANLSRSVPVPTPAQESPKDVPSLENLYDLNSVLHISGNNPNFVRSIIETFVQDTPPAVAAMKQAFVDGKLDVVRTIAHQIKPGIGHLGVKGIQEDIRLLVSGVFDAHTEERISRIEFVIDRVITDLKKGMSPGTADF